MNGPKPTEELKAARSAFLGTPHKNRSFVLSIRYFRAVKAHGFNYTSDATIETHCPKHVHAALKAQLRLEGVI